MLFFYRHQSTQSEIVVFIFPRNSCNLSEAEEEFNLHFQIRLKELKGDHDLFEPVWLDCQTIGSKRCSDPIHLVHSDNLVQQVRL